MFDTEIDINTIVGVSVALVVLVTSITAMLGFSIKKLFHILKG